MHMSTHTHTLSYLALGDGSVGEILGFQARAFISILNIHTKGRDGADADNLRTREVGIDFCISLTNKPGAEGELRPWLKHKACGR